MTIAVVLDSNEWVSAYLVNVNEGASEEEILEAIAKEIEVAREELDDICKAFHWFELEPLAAERLRKLEWPKTYVDADMDSQALHRAVVYAAFAKGGPTKLECLEAHVGA